MIIVDTGVWLALANRRDTHHSKACDAISAVNERLITTWPVMTETCHLLLSRLGDDAQNQFIRSLADGAFDVFDLEAAHAGRIEELMERYCNLPMDLADASLVLLAESLGSGKILSTDQRDFNTYRWKTRKPFKNLMKF